ncbi:MAG TPA: beta-propeller domain-containing protein, partial [Gammaproteobacteria bacterium]
PTVYVSTNHLFLAESAQDWWWHSWEGNEGERLNLHAFDITDGGMEYAGSGRVEGVPVNQFALDEHDGVLRVATWTGGNRWWWTDSAIESRLYTLRIDANALTPLGELRGIAPGEQLFAARFAGDVAYLVTFEQIDPLFTVDLSDPANPAIIGELEVPGFSTYLHALDGGRLLAVGVGGDETGATWNTVVSLFDVSTLAAPALLARYDFARDDSGWNWSEALYEHKAFQFHAERGLLALPLGASRVSNDIWEWSSTLELVKVEGDALSAYGSVDHSAYFDSDDGSYHYSPDIRRSFFIGDFIYAISAKAVTVHPADNPAVTVADALISTN